MQLEYFKYCSSYYYKKIFRPPMGKLNLVKLNIKAKGYKIIMWDVLSADFDQNITKESV
jgi:hypothetical protein